jgi:hypothetical protein
VSGAAGVGVSESSEFLRNGCNGAAGVGVSESSEFLRNPLVIAYMCADRVCFTSCLHHTLFNGCVTVVTIHVRASRVLYIMSALRHVGAGAVTCLVVDERV